MNIGLADYLLALPGALLGLGLSIMLKNLIDPRLSAKALEKAE
jgi:hypothetical protein